MATSQPLVSSVEYAIAGILTTVYGLEELPAGCQSVSCLWLHHGRLDSKKRMEPVASAFINDWNGCRLPNCKVGLIAITIDQRNHGARKASPSSNQGWKEGNERHAQDMLSIVQGTVLDTSLLIDHLGSYILEGPNDPSIDQHLVMGVSLGGHVTWQSLFCDPRVTAGVVIIGCPDYMYLLSDRARLCKLQSYLSSNGAEFIGSKDFPNALMSAARKGDPKGILFGTDEIQVHPSVAEQHRLRGILDAKIRGKKILVCSGAEDKLVPYRCSEPFMLFLKSAVNSWYRDGNVYVEDNVYAGVGHEYSDGMAADASRFICDILAGKSASAGTLASKI